MEEVEDMVFVQQLNSFVHQWIELGNILENIPDIPNLRLVQIIPPACIAIALTHSIEGLLNKHFWRY